jgi:hypothetical protein
VKKSKLQVETEKAVVAAFEGRKVGDIQPQEVLDVLDRVLTNMGVTLKTLEDRMPPPTAKEKAWARRIGKKLGGLSSAEVLNMRWTEFQALSASFGLTPALKPLRRARAQAPAGSRGASRPKPASAGRRGSRGRPA